MARQNTGPLWGFWVASTVLSATYAVLALVTFFDLLAAQHSEKAGCPGSQLNGALAGTLMSTVLCGALVIVSFIVLLSKSWQQRGTGFSYGFVDASYLHLAWLAMLTGIVLSGDTHWATQFVNSGEWQSSQKSTFTATLVFAFITSAAYVATFAGLILYRRAVQNKQAFVNDMERRLTAGMQLSHQPSSSVLGSAPPTPERSDQSAPAAAVGGTSVRQYRAGGAWNVGSY